MPTKSGDKVVRRRAVEVPPITPGRLAEIRGIPDEAIDTSDIPELPRGHRVRRDRDGRLPPRRGAIREAIASVMASRAMTPYALWKGAQAHCPTITETAVGEFLKGKRSIGIEYVEALLLAADLRIVRNSPPASPED